MAQQKLAPASAMISRRAPGKPYFSQTLYRAFWFKLGLAAARLLSVNGGRRVGRLLGEAYALTHPRTRAALQSNLSLVCNSDAEQRLIRRTFRNFGATLADYFQLGTRSKAQAQELFETKLGFENIHTALAGGKGVLLVTIHTALFELGGLVMNEFQLPLVVLSLPEPDPALDEWRAAYRRRWGVETLEVGRDQFSFVAIQRELAQGKCVAMLVDRPHHGHDAVLVDFPHGQIPFSTGPVWLSLLTGAPLVPSTIVATPTGKYAIHAQPALYPKWNSSDRAATVREYSLELAARFRETICEHPDQWYQFVPLSPSR